MREKTRLSETTDLRGEVTLALDGDRATFRRDLWRLRLILWAIIVAIGTAIVLMPHDGEGLPAPIEIKLPLTIVLGLLAAWIVPNTVMRPRNIRQHRFRITPEEVIASIDPPLRERREQIMKRAELQDVSVTVPPVLPLLHVTAKMSDGTRRIFHQFTTASSEAVALQRETVERLRKRLALPPTARPSDAKTPVDSVILLPSSKLSSAITCGLVAAAVPGVLIGAVLLLNYLGVGPGKVPCCVHCQVNVAVVTTAIVVGVFAFVGGLSALSVLLTNAKLIVRDDKLFVVNGFGRRQEVADATEIAAVDVKEGPRGSRVDALVTLHLTGMAAEQRSIIVQKLARRPKDAELELVASQLRSALGINTGDARATAS